MTPDTPVIHSYVYHGPLCWYVSTIERDSSAMVEPPPLRYNETIVWEWDQVARKRGELIYDNGACKGVITQHMAICRYLFERGTMDGFDPT